MLLFERLHPPLHRLHRALEADPAFADVEARLLAVAVDPREDLLEHLVALPPEHVLIVPPGPSPIRAFGYVPVEGCPGLTPQSSSAPRRSPSGRSMRTC